MEKLRHLFLLCKYIRKFFDENNFLETPTPPIVENPGIEPHIHPFEIRSVNKNENLNLYLHTSPEFHMKSLLSKGFENIYNLAYSFRDEPNSPYHRKQFLMLEWYRTNKHYNKIMEDCINLYNFCYEKLNPEKEKINKFDIITVDEIFYEYLKFEVTNFLNFEDFYHKIEKDLPDIQLSRKDLLQWDDLFFLVFLNKIEPNLKNYPFLILKEYPSHLCALSKLKDEKHCERFELYINGIEIANCFHELTSYEEQKKRYLSEKELKSKLYKYELPSPNILLNSLERGLPDSSGIALGVERFLNAFFDYKNPFYE